MVHNYLERNVTNDKFSFFESDMSSSTRAHTDVLIKFVINFNLIITKRGMKIHCKGKVKLFLNKAKLKRSRC